MGDRTSKAKRDRLQQGDDQKTGIMKKFKKGTWVICKWKKSHGGETDIAKVQTVFEDAIRCNRFFRIKGKTMLNLSMEDWDVLKIKDWRYSEYWRPMTQKEKIKYFDLILSK